MWMMGYNDGGEYNRQESFSTRKLRPLIPRPLSSSTNNIPNSTSSPSLTRLHGTDFFALNQHMEQSKREASNTQPAVVVSSRWNPTPEQLRTLEELYRRGTRTPSADQIQHITAQLRRYGKIEGKNVFYWFQNHKARERQKRRRQMETPAGFHEHRDLEIHERKESSGSSRTCYEGEQTKNWAASTNCSTLPEESAPSIQKTGGVAECRPDGWIQFEQGELQQPARSFMERNATWQQMMHLSSGPPPPLTRYRHLIINPTTSTPPPPPPTTRAITPPPSPSAATRAATIRTIVDPDKLIETHDLMDIFIASSLGNGGDSTVINGHQDHRNGGGRGGGSDSQTLQLFPVQGSDAINGKERESLITRDDNNKDSIINPEAPSSVVVGGANSNLTSFQFYEFLPLKN